MNLFNFATECCLPTVNCGKAQEHSKIIIMGFPGRKIGTACKIYKLEVCDA